MVSIELNRNQTRLVIDMAKFYEIEGFGDSTEIQKIFHDALVKDMNPKVT